MDFFPEERTKRNDYIELSGGTRKIHTGLRLLNLNIQCLRNKVGLLELLADEKKPDVLAISEHWLRRGEAEVTRVQGYSLVSAFCRSGLAHGGTALYVRDQLAGGCVDLCQYTTRSIDLTFECAAIAFQNHSVILCLYRSQLGDVGVFVAHLSDIVADILGKGFLNIILCGDFNINHLIRSTNRSHLFDLFESYSLRSLIKVPTRIARRADGVSSISGLDYIATNIDENDIISCENFQPNLSDHHAQLLTWVVGIGSINNTQLTEQTFESRRINDINISEFRRLFSGGIRLNGLFPNQQEIDCIGYHSYFNEYWDHLLWCFSTAFPLVKVSRNNPTSHVFRFSQDLRSKIIDLRDIKSMYKTFNSEILGDLCRAKRWEVARMIDLEKKTFYTDFIKGSKNKSKATWQLIRDSKKIPQKIEIDQDGILICDCAHLAALFARNFSTVVVNKLHDHFGGSLSQRCTVSNRNIMESFFITPVAAADVLAVINSLPTRCSVGFDGLTTYFVKRCSDILSVSLAEMFNLSLSSGQFPKPLKTAVVVPVPKKGDRHDIANYRPIALLSTISKILERIVADKIGGFLDRFDILNSFQHGFRRNHSTETAIVSLMQCINDAADINDHVVLVSFDLSRAFDTLHPVFLSEKIAKIGLRGRINDWLLSFLTDREFRVKVGSARSDYYNIELGTPQGSVLGPLIFLLYINDLPDHLSEKNIFAYADDIALVISDPGMDGLCRRVNGVVSEFESWCKKNRLIINIDKTLLLKFRSKKASPVNVSLSPRFKMCEEVNLLGATLDADITWQFHVDRVAGRLGSAIYAINSLKRSFGRETLLTAYYGMFYPHLSYAIVVWGLSPHAHRLFVLQKRIVRIIFNLKFRDSCAETFRKNCVLTLACIYIYKALIFIHQNKSQFATRTGVHGYNTRHCNLLCTSRHNHTYFEKSPIYSGIRLYNMLPAEFRREMHINCFKSRLRSFLAKRAYYNVADFVGEMRDCPGELLHTV